MRWEGEEKGGTMDGRQEESGLGEREGEKLAGSGGC